MPALLLAALAVQSGAAGPQYPLACAVAADGTIYVADRDLPGVWKVTPNDGGPVKPTVFKAVKRLFRTPLDAPRCVAAAPPSEAFPAGAVLVGDTGMREVYRLDPNAADPRPEPLLTRPGRVGPIGMPAALAVAADGTLYVADLESQRIYEVPPGGTAAGGEPTAIAAIPGVRGLCLEPGGALLAVSAADGAVRRLAPGAGGEWAVTVAAAGGAFGLPHHAALGPDGSLYVADNYARCIWKLEKAGDGFAAPVKLASGDPLAGPVGLALDATGDAPRLIAADPRARAVFAVDLKTGEVSVVAE